MNIAIEALGHKYFIIGEIYLSSTGKKFKVVEKKLDRNMIIFESIEPVINSGTVVEDHRMGLNISQCHRFTTLDKRLDIPH
jgi:hypothetical protein